MTQPVSTVAEGIDNACRQHMHTAGTDVKEAVHAHCNGDLAGAREHLEAAAESIQKARKFCVATPAPARPEQPRLL